MFKVTAEIIADLIIDYFWIKAPTKMNKCKCIKHKKRWACDLKQYKQVNMDVNGKIRFANMHAESLGQTGKTDWALLRPLIWIVKIIKIALSGSEHLNDSI